MNAKGGKPAAAEFRDPPVPDDDQEGVAEAEAGTEIQERQGSPIPHAPEAEKGLLGSILSEKGSWERVENLVLAEEFYSPIHGNIFAAMAAAAEHHLALWTL